MKKQSLRATLALAFALLVATASIAMASPTPPTQPTSGPGSSDYPYTGAPFISGQGGIGGWTIAEPNPRPTTATPVIVVIHGNCLVPIACDVNDVSNLGRYETLVLHLAKKGNVVIYPRFQSATNKPKPDQQTQKTLDGIAGAIDELQNTSGATPLDLDSVGVVGHSRGGWIGANVVALMEDQGLPHPDYFISIAPTNESGSSIPKEDWSGVPSDMLLIAAVGEDDTTTGEGTGSWGAGEIYDDMTTVSSSNKDYVRVRSDAYGSPALDADHNYAGDQVVDAMDWFMVFKLIDAHRDCTALGTNCSYTQGDTANQRHMGLWSDSTPVNELCVTDDPSESWAASCANSLP